MDDRGVFFAFSHPHSLPSCPSSCPSSLSPLSLSLSHLGVNDATGLAARAVGLHLIPTQDLGEGLAHLTAVGVLDAHKEELEGSGGGCVRHAARAVGGLAEEGGRAVWYSGREGVYEK